LHLPAAEKNNLAVLIESLKDIKIERIARSIRNNLKGMLPILTNQLLEAYHGLM